MHRAAYHFIKTLHIPSFAKSKRALQPDEGNNNQPQDLDELEGDDDDIDMSTEIEASSNDAAAMASTTMTNFEPGDVLGKLLAFINQVRMSSEGVRAYLDHVCAVNQVKPIKLRLWVRTRWGSMSHCLESALAIQKVSFYDNWFTLHWLFALRPLITFVLLLTLTRICRRSKIRSGLTIG